MAFVATLAANHGKTQAPEAPDYPSSSSEDGTPPLEPDTTKYGDHHYEKKNALNVEEEVEYSNEAGDTKQPLPTSPNKATKNT